ncbi:MAG: dephospho-CoA kinase [Paracoccaceae bacterium]
MSFRLGLTGSIGMGKSTTAGFFEKSGCAVWDADAAVHRLYAKGGEAVDPIRSLFPKAVVKDEVSRSALKEELAKTPSGFEQLEKVVHPLVAKDRAAFTQRAAADILVFDIPLLFETGGHRSMDAVVCVSISAAEQKKRVLERKTMTAEQFEQILARQMPITEKLEKADYVVTTDTLEHAKEQVDKIVQDIRENRLNA